MEIKQVKKALSICPRAVTRSCCKKCPYYTVNDTNCINSLMQDALEVINTLEKKSDERI